MNHARRGTEVDWQRPPAPRRSQDRRPDLSGFLEGHRQTSVEAHREQLSPLPPEAHRERKICGTRLPIPMRKGECFWVDIRLIYHEAGPNYGGLRFDAGESKSGDDELVHGGIAGWELLMFLADHVRARRQTRLIT